MNSFGTQEELVHRQVEQWAVIQPNHPFVYYGEQRKTLTYKAFNDRVNQVANGLLEEGIAKGDRISVFMKNPLMTTVAMFAIWKCGAVFCPINFNFKGKLLSYPLKDTNPIILITERSMVGRLNDIAYDVPCVNAIVYSPSFRDHDYKESSAKERLHSIYNEKDWSLVVSENHNNPNVELNYFDMANIIYTSGTTGPAKGVVQSHRWVYGYTRGLRRLVTREDVVYNDLPLYHVGGAFANIARAAFVGAGIALYDKFSPTQFWKRIKDSQATCAILLDVMIPWLMNAETKNTDRENTLNKVHMQPLPKYHQEVAHRFGFDVITSGFGQTEVGNPLSSAIVHGLDGKGTPDYLRRGYTLDEMMALLKDDGVPIMRGDEVNEKGFMGKPNAHFELAILNEYDEEQPPGVIGQIGFRPQLPSLILTEYFNKPESTTKAFKNLWFHSGDAGYLGLDGYYYFVDRLGSVIRCRGEKISSYQLEDIINGHDDINLTAAFPIPAKQGDEDDVAVYCERKPGATITEDELQSWCIKQMPKYMVPTYIRFIDEIPRTPTNKIEKYKLREMLLSEAPVQNN